MFMSKCLEEPRCLGGGPGTDFRHWSRQTLYLVCNNEQSQSIFGMIIFHFCSVITVSYVELKNQAPT